ncbi:hypothetical protein BD289DRAFT_484731 [Coniella lustricola]|uniref:Vacuolar protein sorting-associated protein 62 n=1 Tax=Coniella lustricola TaxID=2025994 RepID=A0A2T3A124_9PEZI|nr:hypothetical protein BD289DRAFT_484731 [Coniella lustricola]
MARCSSLDVALLRAPWIFLLLCWLPWSAAFPPTLPREDEAISTVPDYVTRFAPLLWLHSEDPFRPADILQHVRHTTPAVQFQPMAGLPDLDLDSLAWLNDQAGSTQGPVALTANDDITALPEWLLGETPDAHGALHNSTACVVVLVPSARDPVVVDAFYFYFYSYDRGANITQVLPPLKSLLDDIADGMHYGNHVGDWEHNMVRFRNGTPVGIYYSQHSDGSAYDWDDETLSLTGERPVVYSAYGSHANWAFPGDHIHDEVLVDYCDAGQLWDPVSMAYFYRFDPTTTKLTRIYPPGLPNGSNFTSFLHYSGLWGDLQYPDDHPRQKTVPYFGLKRYVSGPTGPMTKQLVRKGLFPDDRGRKSWLQWAVGVFMSLYPCCFRGWRAWLSGAVFVGLLTSFVLAFIFAVTRHRASRTGYKKVDAGVDVPLETLEYRDDINSGAVDDAFRR